MLSFIAMAKWMQYPTLDAICSRDIPMNIQGMNSDRLGRYGLLHYCSDENSIWSCVLYEYECSPLMDLAHSKPGTATVLWINCFTLHWLFVLHQRNCNLLQCPALPHWYIYVCIKQCVPDSFICSKQDNSIGNSTNEFKKVFSCSMTPQFNMCLLSTILFYCYIVTIMPSIQSTVTRSTWMTFEESIVALD